MAEKKELFRMRTNTEGMDVVLEREGTETWLVLDFWVNGTREGAALGVSDRQLLARALNKSVRDELAPQTVSKVEKERNRGGE